MRPLEDTLAVCLGQALAIIAGEMPPNRRDAVLAKCFRALAEKHQQDAQPLMSRTAASLAASYEARNLEAQCSCERCGGTGHATSGHGRLTYKTRCLRCKGTGLVRDIP